MAVKACQPQVQCDKQVSTRTYVTTAVRLHADRRTYLSRLVKAVVSDVPKQLKVRV